MDLFILTTPNQNPHPSKALVARVVNQGKITITIFNGSLQSGSGLVIMYQHCEHSISLHSSVSVSLHTSPYRILVTSASPGKARPMRMCALSSGPIAPTHSWSVPRPGMSFPMGAGAMPAAPLSLPWAAITSPPSTLRCHLLLPWLGLASSCENVSGAPGRHRHLAKIWD